MIDEGLLQRVKRSCGAHALNRSDVSALVLHGQRQAAVDALTFRQDGAGAAGALVAALLCSGELQMVTQKVKERRPRIDLDLQNSAVDVKAHEAS